MLPRSQSQEQYILAEPRLPCSSATTGGLGLTLDQPGWHRGRSDGLNSVLDGLGRMEIWLQSQSPPA